jgi:hypothetical protein
VLDRLKAEGKTVRNIEDPPVSDRKIFELRQKYC